jgi:hypothetical protein
MLRNFSSTLHYTGIHCTSGREGSQASSLEWTGSAWAVGCVVDMQCALMVSMVRLAARQSLYVCCAP